MSYRRVCVLFVSMLSLLASAIAADATGKWIAQYETPGGMREATYDFKVEADQLTGKVTTSRGDSEIQEGNVSGDEISFVRVLSFQDREMRMLHKGKVSGDEIQFTVTVGDRTMEFVAKRAK